MRQHLIRPPATIYNTLLQRLQHQATQSGFLRELQNEPWVSKWKHTDGISTHAQWFWYRLSHGAINFWAPNAQDTCRFCAKSVPDKWDHLFLTCPTVARLWSRLIVVACEDTTPCLDSLRSAIGRRVAPPLNSRIATYLRTTGASRRQALMAWQRLWRILVTETCRSMWRTRTRMVWEQPPPTHPRRSQTPTRAFFQLHPGHHQLLGSPHSTRSHSRRTLSSSSPTHLAGPRIDHSNPSLATHITLRPQPNDPTTNYMSTTPTH